MEIIIGENFADEAISLDDKQFVRCTFTNCILEYGGGEVSFDCTEMRGCRHVFYGRARRTLHYLQGVGLMAYDASEWGEFSETVN